MLGECEKITVTGKVDIVGHYPEYAKQVTDNMKRNRSMKDNWLGLDGRTKEPIDISGLNTIQNGMKIIAAMLGRLPSERNTEIGGLSHESVADWGVANGDINRWNAAPPSCMQIKDNTQGGGPYYMTRWFIDDNGWDGRWCTEDDEYVKFITDFQDSAANCDCLVQPGVEWASFVIDTIYLATGQWRIRISDTMAANPDVYTDANKRFFRPIFGAWQNDDGGNTVSHLDFGDANTAYDTDRYYYFDDDRDSIHYGGADLAVPDDVHFDVVGAVLTEDDLKEEDAKGPQCSYINLTDSITKSSDIMLAVAWTYSFAEA